ncbi:hypothetical protein CU044_4089 [Streptomyces sp. L-9-10]|uniref:hypothetical protein n=1 Tax=Streptomyces sp. L-9-10 TaxID=1478131 RepID=UPI0010D30961|nr:hypothetical protein [Streptomyces sp. L-9-10]RYJ25522.1 hypothetical protein CU044_4089 [Streptomyces sp. L-9-10]
MSDSMAGPAGRGSEQRPGERTGEWTGERPERETAGEPAGETARETGAAGPAAHDPAAPLPLGLERIPTGDAEVDALLTRLADADHLPADGHVEVYEDVHRGLRDALTALDARPAPQGVTGPQGFPPPQGPRGQPTPR